MRSSEELTSGTIAAARKRTELSKSINEQGNVAGTIVNTSHALAASAAIVVETAREKVSKGSPKALTARKRPTRTKKAVGEKKVAATKEKPNKSGGYRALGPFTSCPQDNFQIMPPMCRVAPS